ncbi:MAG TPA: hypothetical protein VF960_01490 [Chloroflexota bacterium]
MSSESTITQAPLDGRAGGVPAASARPRTPSWALPTGTVLQAIPLFGIFVMNFFMQTDPDLYWHLATGRYIVESGGLPQTDMFSYTAVGVPWVVLEWLGEVTIYLLYAWGGYITAVVFFGAAIALAFFFVLRSLRLLGLGAIPSTMITFWSAAISTSGWSVRPQALSYLFFSLFLYLLLRSRNRKMDRWIWLLPAAMVVWVNFHGSYVMGLMLLGLFLAGECLSRFGQAWAGERPRALAGAARLAVSSCWPLVRAYLPVSVATVLSTAVNPEGFALLLYPLTYTSDRSYNFKYITEWQSPNFHEYYLLVVFGSSLVLLIALATRRPTDWALLLPMVAVTVMSLQFVRTLPFYAIIFAPYLAVRATRAGSVPASTTGGSRHATRWNWLLMLLCFAAMGSTPFLSSDSQLGREPRTDDYPVQGAQYIKDAGLTGHLFNTYHWGGFLLWKSYPGRSVFIDGRSDMYGSKLVDEYREVYRVAPNWKGVLDKYDVQVVLVEKDIPLTVLLTASGEWKEAFRGPVESVLVRAR